MEFFREGCFLPAFREVWCTNATFRPFPVCSTGQKEKSNHKILEFQGDALGEAIAFCSTTNREFFPKDLSPPKFQPEARNSLNFALQSHLECDQTKKSLDELPYSIPGLPELLPRLPCSKIIPKSPKLKNLIKVINQ